MQCECYLTPPVNTNSVIRPVDNHCTAESVSSATLQGQPWSPELTEADSQGLASPISPNPGMSVLEPYHDVLKMGFEAIGSHFEGWNNESVGKPPAIVEIDRSIVRLGRHNEVDGSLIQ